MISGSNFFVNNLNPVALKLGFLQIHWYSLAYLFGAIFVYFAVNKTFYLSNIGIQKQNKKDFLDTLLFNAMLGVILGGRLGYVILYSPLYFLTKPWEIAFVWQGGMSFHGGLLGVVLATYVTAKKYKVKLLAITDLLACFVPFALFLGRLANFVNQELYGAITNVPWAVIFPKVDYNPRHASQLYEALLEGVLLFIIMLFLLLKTKVIKKTGVLSALLLILYSAFRFFVEFFRLPDAHIGYLFASFTLGHLLSLLFFIAGLILLRFSIVANK